MAKRISKLMLQYGEIEDEKRTLVSTLDKALSQLNEYIDKLNDNQSEADQKQVQNVLYYEIQFLQKLLDMNFDLESFLKQSPLEIDSETNEEPIQNQPTSSNELSSTFSCISLNNGECTNESLDDITTLKDNLKKFTEKMGFTDNSLNTIRNYYDKPGRSVEETPSCSKDTDNFEFVNVEMFREEKLNNSTNQIDILQEIKLQPVEENVKNALVNSSSKKRKNSNKIHKQNLEIKDKDVPEPGTTCAFSHVETPNEFYLHLLDSDCKLIDELPKLIAAENVKSTPFSSKEEAFNYIDKYCVFLSESYDWVRAEILNWNLDKRGDTVEVKLIDYGNNIPVSYRKLRMMSEKLTRIPKLALRCHLPWLYPVDYSLQNRRIHWEEHVIEALLSIAGLVQINNEENTTLFNIVFASRHNNSVAIDLHNINESPENTVGQMLITLDYAVQIIDEYNDDFLEVDEFLQDYDAEEPANINEAIIGYDARDEARICRFTRPDGTCFKGKNCKLEHVPISKDGFTTDTIPAFFGAMNSLLVPAKGETAHIVITSFINSCSFYAQIIRTPFKLKSNKIMDKDLHRLLERMNSSKNVKKYNKFKVLPAIGEIVIAKHWSNYWVRAIVREYFNYNDNFKVQVFLLDFGDIFDVCAKDLRQITEVYLELPFQAVECYLENVQEKPNVDKAKARQFFKEHIEQRNFFAQIMSDSMPLKLAVTTLKGLDIAKKLEEFEFVEPRKFDLHPCDDGQISLH